MEDDKDWIYQFGYPKVEKTLVSRSSSINIGNSPFFGSEDPVEKGLYRRNYSDIADNYHKAFNNINNDNSISGDDFDINVKTLMFLEFFREMYVRQKDLLHKVFPGVKDGFARFFKTISEVLSSSADEKLEGGMQRTLRRSLSVGSPRRLEKFKIRTVDPGDDGDYGDGDTTIKSSGGTKQK